MTQSDKDLAATQQQPKVVAHMEEMEFDKAT